MPLKNSLLRRLSRAFTAKDERAFDEALEELEEGVDDRSRDRRDEMPPEEPDAIEIHNHMPAASDDAMGELPPKEAPGFDHALDAAPPWFQAYARATDHMFKKLGDDISALQNWAKEEEKEPEHQEDAGNLENLGSYAKDDEEEESDRHVMDEPAERQEMAEKIKENQGKDRRGRDEGNQEILGELEFEAPPGTGVKDARKARDSAFLQESFQDVVSKAEILAPGLRVPTFDRASAPVRTAKAILGLRRTALDLAYGQPATRGVIDQALSGRALDTKRMSHGTVRVLFNSVAAAVATGNNTRATDRSASIERGGRAKDGAQITSLADINARNAARYSGRKSA